MRSNYKPIGELVTRIDERNTDGEATELIGVSIDKCFIKSVANTIGTDLTKYKIIRKDDFAVSLMQVSRDSKIPVARQTEYDIAIMSPAYPIFRVTDKNVILPEYLDMWFKRSEFDREAAFIAVGGVRGSMPWDEFAQMEVHVPDIEIQKKIVRDYQIIEERIELKKKINDNLAATINAYFAEFYTTKCPNETILSNICTLASSKRVFADDYVSNGIPFYRGGEISLKQSGEPITDPLYITEEHFQALKEKYGAPACDDILITAVGTIGNSYLVEDEEFYFKDGNIIWLKNFILPEYSIFIYDYMQSKAFKQQLDGICIGSTQTALTIVSLSQLNLCYPNEKELAEYVVRSRALRNEIQHNNKEILALHDMAKTLLSALSNR